MKPLPVTVTGWLSTRSVEGMTVIEGATVVTGTDGPGGSGGGEGSDAGALVVGGEDSVEGGGSSLCAAVGAVDANTASTTEMPNIRRTLMASPDRARRQSTT